MKNFLLDHDTQTPTPGPGRTVRLADSGQETAFDFGYTPDGLPERTTLSGPIAGEVSLSYNPDLEVDGLFVNGDKVADYDYDDDGLPTDIGELTFIRDADSGRIEETQLGDDYKAIPTYDPDYGQLTRLELVEAPGGEPIAEPIAEYDFQRDDLGRIEQRTETINGQPTVTDYVYDPDTGTLDQVWVDSTLAREYDYDGHGNRSAYTDYLDPANTIDPADIDIDDDDKLIQYGDSTYTYTDNGELDIITVEGTITRDFAYDGLGRLDSVTLDPGDETEQTVEYIYDPSGNRIGTKIDGEITQSFLYAGGTNPIAQLADNGEITTFVYAGSHVPAYMKTMGGDTYMFITDQIGTVRAVADAITGNIVQELDYDEYGNLTNYTGDLDFQPFGYAGGLRDDTTNLTHYGARDYDPHTGRFTTPDPIGQTGGTNLYTYVGNDPTNNIDPTGLFYSPSIEHGADRGPGYVDWAGIDQAASWVVPLYDLGKALLSDCPRQMLAGLSKAGIAIEILSMIPFLKALQFLKLKNLTYMQRLQFMGRLYDDGKLVIPLEHHVLDASYSARKDVITFYNRVLDDNLNEGDLAVHESVHRLLSPKLGAFARDLRINAAEWGYKNVKALHVIEETLAYSTQMPLGEAFQKALNSWERMNAGPISMNELLFGP